MKIERHHRNRSTGTGKPGFSDKLPIATARVQVLKASYRQAWLYFLLALCLLVAWGMPIRYLVMQWLAFRPASTGTRDAYEFVALAYTGISSNPDEISPENFREQIKELRKAGYQAITLNDVIALYEENRPLPRRALLLTFDHARKSSYFDARRVLRSAGWSAVMFLWTKPIQDKDQAALRWPYVRSMLVSRAWEAGAQSHNGFAQVPADSEGTRNNFMTTPRWLTKEMRYEPPDDFRQRLVDDHNLCRRIIMDETGYTPLAYAFPYGDFGQFDERAIFTRRLNLDLVSQYYKLGFIHGTSALNTGNSDPRRLNRLLVQPEWSARELLQRLEYAWPQTTGYYSPEVLASPLNWLVDWGNFKLADGHAAFIALPGTTGAKAWLNGSDLYRDFHLRLRLRVTAGQFGIFCRATPDGESHVYFALGDDGDVWLRQKHAGMQPFTLASGRYLPDRDGIINLEIFIRDRLFYASVNGRPVFTEIASIRGELRPGMVGFSVWHPRPGLAGATMESLDLKPFTTSFLTWLPAESRTPQLADWLGHHAYRFTHLAPPWQRLVARGQSEQFGWDAEFFHTLAQIYRMQLHPEIIIENMEGSASDLPERLAQTANAIPAQGIMCDFNQFKGTHSPARVTAWLQSLSRSMEAQDLQLVARLPEFLKTAPALASLFQGMTNMVVAMDQAAATQLRKGNYRHQIADIHYAAPGTNDKDMVVHQLTGPLSPMRTWPDEASTAILRTDGYAAYRSGDFENAIEIWKHWSELEPQNGEPLSLIGDVHQRLGRIDEAVDHYLASLERNPGQIELLVRCVRLMSRETRRTAEAQSLLELYERLFPDNPDIVLAQAELLMHQKLPEEAAAKINSIIETHPEDIEARAILHGLLPDSRARVNNLNSMLEVGARPGREKQLVQTIARWNLLRWPESWRLMEFLERMRELAPNPEEKNILKGMLPRTTVVREDFHAGRISDNWLVSGDPVDQRDDTAFLGTDLTQTEAVLQLQGSDTMTGGFIEALVEDVRGFFWLYARRSETGMIRFGFEQTGRIFLQIWQDGKVVVNQNRSWKRPEESFRIRLEIRGTGATGFVNDKPVFGAPIPIPSDMNMGWWGIAPWAPKFGVAQALLREINGGPLPIRMGIFQPRTPDWSDRQYLAALRPWNFSICTVAPPWFVHALDGSIRSELVGERTDLRILCRYYQIRLIPCVRSASHRMLDPRDLVELARTAELDGFTLLFNRMPDQAWIDRAEEALIGTDLTLMATMMKEDESIMEIREISAGVGLFAGARRTRELPVFDQTTDTDAAAVEIPPETSAVLMFGE